MLHDFRKTDETRFHGNYFDVAVVGLGYVGLPLVKRLTEVGLTVLGIDIKDSVVNSLNSGHSFLEDLPDEDIQKLLQKGFSASSDFQMVQRSEAVIVCVPTPLDANNEPDLSCVESALTAIAPNLKPGHLISLESTTWPGTTREVVCPLLSQRGLTVGKDIFVVFSPEREDPGNRKYSVRNTPKLVGGITEACLKAGIELYEKFVDTIVPVSSPEVAEMAKVVENTYRLVNISLVNELKVVASKLGIDVFEVLDAAGTKPFGFQRFSPGPGVGGHCIPVDPLYLTWAAKRCGIDVRCINVAIEINDEMPRYVCKSIVSALGSNHNEMNGKRVLVLGITYKPNIADLRESSCIQVLQELCEVGIDVAYSDPFIPFIDIEVNGESVRLTSTDIDDDAISVFDVVALLCDHSSFDYESLATSSRVLVDTRGRFSASAENVIRA